MNEELFLLGKNNPDIVPELQIWGIPISLYLFLGGMSAGILFFSTTRYLFRRENRLPSGTNRASQIAVISLIIGSIALLFDLHRIITVWRLFTHFDLAAPMSWGAWTLLAVIPLAIIWSVPYELHMIKKWRVKQRFERMAERLRGPVAFLLAILSVILAVYTGMLLSAFVARPLWNSGLLPALFLVSGLSTGIVILIWTGRAGELGKTHIKIDIALIATEILLIGIYILDLYSGSAAQVAAIGELIHGQFAFYFWVLVVFIGLIVPAVIEYRELRGARIPLYAVPVLVLFGGLVFRVIIVEAGQLLML